MITDALWSFFNWPTGAVWGNLVASALWAPTAFTVSHKLLKRHHTRLINQQTEELKAHVTDTATGGDG